jgi:beta-glucanase (GH16 family)
MENAPPENPRSDVTALRALAPRTGRPRGQSSDVRRRGPVLLAATGVLTVLLMLFASGALQPRPQGLTGTWSLAFSDNFDGRSLDRAKWEPTRYGRDEGGDAPFNPDAEEAWFSANNVSVRDGNLVITLKREPKTLDGRTYEFSSGVVQTEQHYLIKPPAYIEARIKIPKCDGCWPGFWTVTPKVWPPELDIMEFFGTDKQPYPLFSYHTPDRTAISTAYGKPGTDYTAGYHIYGMFWDGYRAVPRLDGTAYPGITQAMTQLPQALILNLSVQAGENPPPGAQMLVDWVRVWRPGAS